MSLSLLAAAVLLPACRAAPPGDPTGGMLPTLSPFFAEQPPSPARGVTPSAEVATPGPVTTPAPREAPGITEWVIYDETLEPDWSTENSWRIRLDLAHRTFVYSGKVSAAITPLQDYGKFYLTLNESAATSYPVTNVVGVSLWVSGGNEVLAPDDLAVTLVGSNSHPYWVEGDASVELDEQHFFSESRLYYLGITRSLPPDTWAEAIVWLDDLPYDPDYRYLTGIYVKNDEQFRRPFFVDRVALLLLQPPSP